MTSLFRPEALEAKRYSSFGNVQISQPLPVRIVAWSCMALFIGVILLLILGTYTRRVHATGQVMPKSGLLTIGAIQAGVISSIKAVEGLEVHRNDIIFVENLDATSLSGPTQQQILADLSRQKHLLESQKSLKERLAPIERQALLNEVHFLSRQREQVSSQLDNDENVLPVMKEALRRMETAKRKYLIPESQFQAQLYTYAQLISAHALALQSQTDIERKISELASKLSEFDGQLLRELNEVDKQVAVVDQQIAEDESRQSNLILAPEDGVLTGVRGYLGEQVIPGTPLVTLLPTGQALHIELYVNSNSIGFLKEGQPVLLRYDAFPYQKFGLQRGHISEITRAPLLSNSENDNQNAQAYKEKDKKNSQDIYRVRVQPDRNYVEAYGIQHLLEAGMTVSADIGTDRRHLWQWLFDPIISISSTLNTTTVGPR